MNFRDLFLKAVRGTDQSGRETSQNASIIIPLPRAEEEPNRAGVAGVIFCVCSYEVSFSYLYLVSSVTFEAP